MQVEMCQHYNWINKPICAKGHRASLKCHSRREDCRDYEPSWHLIPKNNAQEIINQVYAGIREALQTQKQVSEQQLLQLMMANFYKALQEFADTTARKLDELTPPSD